MPTKPAPKKYTVELQYTPAAFLWKLEALLKSVRQNTGYAKLYAEITDDQLKRFEFGEQFLMTKLEEEYRLAIGTDTDTSHRPV